MSEGFELTIMDSDESQCNNYTKYGLCLIFLLLLGYFIAKKYYWNKEEGFSKMVSKYTPETDRVKKPEELLLSPEQQSLTLEQQVRSEYDDLNRSILGSAIPVRDQSFLLSDSGIDDKLVHNQKFSKSCCFKNYYPVPHMNNWMDPAVRNGNFIPTNITAYDDYAGSSCLCADETEWKFLAAKGGNGSYNSPYRQLLF